MSEFNLPLEGIRVIELASVVAAPTAGRILAHFGAEVIKIEAPSGDVLRKVGDMHWLPIEDGNNPLFDLFNSGKQLMAIDLKNPSGMQVLMRLLEQADVFLTNTRMRSLEKMGLDYESIKQRFPKLIYAHFSGFGLTGPDRDRPGYDTTAFWMRTGACGDAVLPGDFPARPSYAFGDIATAGYFLSGILTALLGRERSGHGTLVETSLLNSGIWMNTPYVVNTQAAYGHRLPEGRYEPWNPFSDYYLCRDGKYICPIAKLYPKDRFMMAEIFEMPELAEDPDLATISSMKKSGKEPAVVQKLEQAIAKKDSEEWIRIFLEHDIPYETVRQISDIVNDEQAWANGYLENVRYPDTETVVPVPPVKLSDYRRKPYRIQGRIGADTEAILADAGYSESEISQLRENHAVV